MHALLCWPRSSNGAYVYASGNREVLTSGYQVFLYLYMDPKTAELVWVIGYTHNDEPEDVNHPRYSANPFDHPFALFDSSPSAKGACALNGPASPACKWRECKDSTCFAYPDNPHHTGEHPWYGASGSLKVVVGGKGGH